ncbi:MAG: chemotaxis protein CheW [Acidimicrobiales bacterium]
MTQYCTFVLGELHFGIETLHVQEVIRNREMTCIPLAPGAVRGLINLRGQIVTALDLGRQLDLPGRNEAQPSVHVVVNVDGAAVSLLVDSIGDVVDTDSSTFERPPDTLDEWIRELILGVHKLEGRLLLVLDVMKATDVTPALAG